jgi:hypothetical protein
MLLIEQVSKGYLVLHIGTMPPAADSLRAERVWHANVGDWPVA